MALVLESCDFPPDDLAAHRPGLPAVLKLPATLRRQADKLLAQDKADRRRNELRKRFALGTIGNDVEGFYLDDRPLQPQQLPRDLRTGTSNVLAESSAVRTNVKRFEGPLSPHSRQVNESWIDLATRLCADFERTLRTDPRYFDLLRNYQVNFLPDWVVDAQQDPKRPHHRVQPHFKMDAELLEQVQFLSQLAEENPKLSKFFVPMVVFELTEFEYTCIMPWMTEFITLHELLCAPVGTKEDVPDWMAEVDLREVLERVAQQLAEIMELSAGPADLERSLKDLVLQRVADRFNDNVPVLVGPEIYARCRRETEQRLDLLLTRLFYQRPHGDLRFGHGDLNATNILVAVRQGTRGRIDDVCVRLIDPNPSGRYGDAMFELARLIHWIELGLPMRLASDGPLPAFQIHFRACQDGSSYLDRPSQLAMDEKLALSLEATYSRFIEALARNFPKLNDRNETQKLAVAVGVYHLIATRYWPKNVDRTAAFLAGVVEIDVAASGTSSRPLLPEASSGLWDVRRAVLGRRGRKRSSGEAARRRG